MSHARTMGFVAALACLLPAASVGQIPADLQAAMRARDSAVAKPDPAAWDRLTADGFSVVREDGSLMTKAERLAQLKTDQPTAATPQEHLDIKHYQDVYLRRFLSGGSWILDIWAKDARGWRVVAVQVTTAKK